MKKLSVLLTALVCLFSLAACDETKVEDIPSLDLVISEPIDLVNEKMVGYTQEDLQNKWGKPTDTLSGFCGEYWDLDDTKRVVVFYDENGSITEVAVNEVVTTDALMTDTARNLGITVENYPRIDGSSSTLGIVETIFRVMHQDSTEHFQTNYPKAASKTVPSYHKLIAGEVDLIFVPYASEDVLKAADDAGVELVFEKVAAEALIFITAKDNTAENVTREQIRSIYLDYGITDWKELGGPDRELIPICRNADSGSQSQMDNLVLENESMHPDIQKNYVELTMEGLLEQVAFYHNGGLDGNPTNSYALGYTLYTYLQNMTAFTGIGNNLKILSYDGIAPSAVNIADGSYPLSDGYYAVTRADLPKDHSAHVIIDWLQSNEGQNEIEALGLISCGGN